MLLLSTLAFVALGVVLVLVGSNQAEMARDLGMDLARSGFLGASLALGVGVGITIAGPLADRLPRRPLFVASALVVALSLLTVSPGISYERALLHVVGVGAGVGFYDTILNVACMDRYGDRAGPMLAFVHAGATAGAVAGPPVVGWVTGSWGWAASFAALGVVYLALAGWAAFVPLPGVPAPADDADARAPHARLLSLPLLLLGLVALAYVGVESSLTLFAVPWATSGLGLGEATGRLAISGFWLGLLVGRLVLVPLRRPLGAPLLAVCGLAGALMLGAATASGTKQLVLVATATGLGLGPVYPVMIAVAGRRFPQAAGTAAGIVGGAGALGGFAIPWLTGAIGDSRGIVLAVGTLAAWCLLVALPAAAFAIRGSTSRGARERPIPTP